MIRAMTRRELRNLILAFLAFLFVNSSIPFSIGYRWSKAGQAAAAWPVAEGRVLSDDPAALEYAYSAGGTAYRHSRIRFGFLGNARADLPPLTNGAPVKVSYHPSDPSQAVLLPGASAGTQAMKSLGMIGMIASCAAAFFTWRFFRI